VLAVTWDVADGSSVLAAVCRHWHIWRLDLAINNAGIQVRHSIRPTSRRLSPANALDHRGERGSPLGL
jgi:hypothetical protein